MKKLALCLGILGAISLGTDAVAEPMAAKAAPAKADHATCGQMISGMAPIPAKLSEGASSVADMLEAHAALMGKDKDSMAEAKGLRAIAKTHKQIAALMVKASEEMAKASSWPAAPHDMAKMGSDPKLAAASQKVIDIHKEIIAMFQKMVADMEAQHKPMK
jgi:hypothetical protein